MASRGPHQSIIAARAILEASSCTFQSTCSIPVTRMLLYQGTKIDKLREVKVWETGAVSSNPHTKPGIQILAEKHNILKHLTPPVQREVLREVITGLDHERLLKDMLKELHHQTIMQWVGLTNSTGQEEVSTRSHKKMHTHCLGLTTL